MVLPQALVGKKPWSIVENKWFRMVVFPLCLLCTTVTYYGWQHMQMFLQEGDFLVYLCEPCEAAGDCEVGDIGTCRTQEIAWTTGYTIASSCEAAGSIFAGILFDHLGPLGTALMGQILHYTSWAIILHSNKSKPMWYAGMALNGISVNLSSFPAFTLIDIFPNQRFIMTALVLAGQVSATMVMPILHVINDQIQVGGSKMITGFLLCLALPTTILYLLGLPLTHKHLVREYERKGLQIADKPKPNWKVFGKCVVTTESILFTIWYVLMIMQYNVFSSQLRAMAGAEVSDVVGWMFFLQGPAAVLFGWFNDMTQTIPMCFLLTLMQVYAFALVKQGDVGGYISGLMFVLSNAHIFTTKFCYAAELFPNEHFGKVSGFFAFTAGILTFLNTGLDAMGVPVETQFAMYTLITVPQFFLLAFLGWRQFRKRITYLNIENMTKEDMKRMKKGPEKPKKAEEQYRGSHSGSMSDDGKLNGPRSHAPSDAPSHGVSMSELIARAVAPQTNIVITRECDIDRYDLTDDMDELYESYSADVLT